MYRVFNKDAINYRKTFVEVESLDFAKDLAREISRGGYTSEIREEKNGRWYKLKGEYEKYKKEIENINEEWSDDKINTFIDNMAYDDSLTRKQYCELYGMAIDRYKELFNPF